MSIILLLHTILMALTFGNFQLLTVDYNSIDEPIAELNNHTLREVFENNQLLLNNQFDNNTIWISQNDVITTYENSEVTIQNINTYSGILQTITLIDNNEYYYVFSAKGNGTIQVNSSNAGINEHILTNEYQLISRKIIWDSVYADYFGFANVEINKTNIIDYVYLIDNTVLEISSLTVSQMDNYFNEYQTNKGADDVTYTINEHDMTDLIILLGFGFSWVGIFWILRKVIS